MLQIYTKCVLNSSSPSAAYMRRWTKSACSAPSHYPNQCRLIVNCQFIHANAYENVVWGGGGGGGGGGYKALQTKRNTQCTPWQRRKATESVAQIVPLLTPDSLGLITCDNQVFISRYATTTGIPRFIFIAGVTNFCDNMLCDHNMLSEVTVLSILYLSVIRLIVW